MIITNNIHAATGVYAGQQNRASKAAPYQNAASKADGFYMSSQTQSFGSILQRLQGESDEVRTDKVAALEKAIASGTYSVGAGDIAASMLSMRY